MNDSLQRIVGFLLQIGIPVRAGFVGDDTFLPAVRIEAGGLVYDPLRLRWPSDLLHEAGHIAVTPPERRAALDGALDGGEATAFGGEVEAIAWSWAAAMHLGLAPEALFHTDGYKGQSDGLLMSFSLGVCPGAYGLAQLGMTLIGDAARAAGTAPYPAMLCWLRRT
jgi:hypothetical protein